MNAGKAPITENARKKRAFDIDKEKALCYTLCKSIQSSLFPRHRSLPRMVFPADLFREDRKRSRKSTQEIGESI